MKYYLTPLIIVISLTLSACQKKEGPNDIRVGVITGPETELMETTKEVAAKRGDLNIEIIQFSDYTLPNEALNAGKIDANAFQNTPYLQKDIQEKGYQFTVIAKTFIYPMAIYSKKIKKLSELRNEAIVGIQNDPINQGRALLLLQKANLIQLKPDVGFTATPNDIISNPKKLIFITANASQMPRVLSAVDIAPINTNYAMLANLSPSKNGLFLEDTNTPYANVIVVRTAQQSDPRFVKLIQAFQSHEVIKKAQELFDQEAIPAWKQH